MKVAIFGLGYVGTVSAAAFASLGHEVLGVDTSASKVAMLEAGRTPVVEPGLAELIATERAAGRLRATTDGASAAAASDLSLICVGTPSRQNGSLSTDAIERVAATIGQGMRVREARHTVVLRSTSLPGTAEEVVAPIVARESGLEAGEGFGLAVNPEFLREGSSLSDFFAPAKTVIGELDKRSGSPVAELYTAIDAPVHRVALRVAEMVKYTDNAFHAVKIGFANEIGSICRAVGLDSYDVIDIFLSDTKLNISSAYLRPGFAFGGSCLPKDLRALVHAARRADLDLPLLESVLTSNERHLQRTLDAVVATGLRKIGLIGLSFKPGTDDLRESPLVELAERLLGKGFELRIYDPVVSYSTLVGANREYVEAHLPHLAKLLATSLDEVLEQSEVCVVGARLPELSSWRPRDGQILVDLVRLEDAPALRGQDGYHGVAW
ncbi:MAG: nucleotide sugar dehydrogenase [Actinomycetota bacterium]